MLHVVKSVAEGNTKLFILWLFGRQKYRSGNWLEHFEEEHPRWTLICLDSEVRQTSYQSNAIPEQFY